MINCPLRAVCVEYFQAETESLEIGLRIFECYGGFTGSNGDWFDIAVDRLPNEIVRGSLAYIEQNIRYDVIQINKTRR